MKRVTVIIAPVFLTLIVVIFIAWQPIAYQGKIHYGVSINNKDVSGLSPEEAENILRDLPPPPKNFTVAFRGFGEQLNLSDFGATPGIKAAIKKAYGVGRSDSFIKNAADIFIGRFKTKNLLINFRLSISKLRKHLNGAATQINQPPVDAKRLVSREQIKIDPEQTGYSLLIDDSIREIKASLARNKKRAILAVRLNKPKITANKLRGQKIETLLGEFLTRLDPRQESRNININIAARRIDGSLVPPSGIFSFNETVGPRTASRGYKTATVIENGNLTLGIGGGICQLATTLYNAYMLAGLPTVEREIHSNFIAAYPTGRDASVAEGLYDLKFKNDTGGFILIKSLMSDSSLIVRIYGPKTGRINYFSEPSVVNITPYNVKVEPDNNLPPGVKVLVQKGVAGRTVKVKRLVKVEDSLLFEEEIVSRYQPRVEIINSGPQEATATAE